MVRGGKRENAGRKPINPEDSKAMEQVMVRVPKELKEEITEIGIGKTIGEKIRYVLSKGLETIRKEQE